MSTKGDNGKSGPLPFDEKLCERYLFGELTEAELERFETAYFSDDSFFNSFLAVKDEILDLYSRNELDHERRRRMEPHFLSTIPRRKRLSESKDFVDSVTRIAERSEGRVPLLGATQPGQVGVPDALKGFFTPQRFAAVGVLVVVLTVGTWLLLKRGTSETNALFQDQPARATEPLLILEGSPETVAGSDDAQRPPEPGGSSQPRTKPSAESRAAANSAGVNPITADPVPGPSATPHLPRMLPADPQMAVKEPPNPNTFVKEVPVPDATNKRIDSTPEITISRVDRDGSPGDRTESVNLDSATRSATKQNTAVIGWATQNVKIRMVLGDEEYSSYSVRISGVGGDAIWQASNLKAGINNGAKSLTVTVPASLLSSKDYIVILEGRAVDGTTETIREYYLRVDRQ